MGVHDLAFEYVGNTWPERLAADLLGLESVAVAPLAREITHVKRQADLAVVVRVPRPARVLHAEHVKQRADLRRVVARHALYHDVTGLPVDTCVVQTSRKTARKIPSVYRFGLAGQETCVPLRSVRIWQMQVEAVLEQRRWELYPFLAGMQRRMDAASLLREGRRHILEDVPVAEHDQTFAAFWFVSEDLLGADLVERTLGRIEMAETTLGQRLIDLGRKEGLEQGLEKGLEQGRREEAIGAVLAVLEARFGRLPRALTRKVRTIDDLEQLARLIRRAAIVPSAAELQQEL